MEMALPMQVWFEVFGQREQGQAQHVEPIAKRRKLLLCLQCQGPITWADARIDVKGSHLHSFFNPHGIIFHIGCFSEAPGCAPASLPSSEFTWFPGYSWQVAHCGNCHEHLGWAFQGEHGSFHGLILNRLVEKGED